MCAACFLRSDAYSYASVNYAIIGYLHQCCLLFIGQLETNFIETRIEMQ